MSKAAPKEKLIAEKIKAASLDVKATKEQAEEALAIATAAEAVTIHDEQGFEEASSILLEVKDRGKQIEARRKLITKPMMEAKKEVDELFKAPIASLKKAETKLKRAIGEYVERVEAEQQEMIVEAQEAHEAGSTTLEVREKLVEATQRTAPKVKGVSMRTVTKFEIVDVEQLPRHLMKPDEAKIRAMVNSGLTVPGVRTWTEKSVSARPQS